MTIIEQIKAEIERHINELDISDVSIYIEEELQEILSFLSTLKSEKPEADLEKEIETSIRYLNGLHTLEDNKSWYKGRYEELKEFARHFYDLGCHRTAEKYDEIEYERQKEEESEKPMNLDELKVELDIWRHDHFHGARDGHFSGEYLERISQLELARHFAQWGAEHLKK